MKNKYPDFEKLDKEREWFYPNLLAKKVKKLGYTFISEAIWKEILEKNKMTKKELSSYFGLNDNYVSQIMKEWNFPQKKDKWKKIKDPDILNKIRNMKGTMSPEKVSKLFGCSTMTILRIWANVSPYEVKNDIA